VEINNYSVLYANKISEANNMSIVASDYSLEGASGSAFSSQFALVYATTAQTLSSVSNTMKLTLSNGNNVTVTANTFNTPNLEGVIVVGRFLADSVYDNTDAHSAVSVII